MTVCAAHTNLYSNECAADRYSLRVKYVQGIFEQSRVPTLPRLMSEQSSVGLFSPAWGGLADIQIST